MGQVLHTGEHQFGNSAQCGTTLHVQHLVDFETLAALDALLATCLIQPERLCACMPVNNGKQVSGLQSKAVCLPMLLVDRSCLLCWLQCEAEGFRGITYFLDRCAAAAAAASAVVSCSSSGSKRSSGQLQQQGQQEEELWLRRQQQRRRYGGQQPEM
jgi:hypothetical protein